MSKYLDLEEFAATAARAAAEKLTSDIDDRVERALVRVLERRASDQLVGLHKLRGGTAASARMFLARHPDLRQLGVKIGARLLFKRSDWDGWLAAHRTVAK